MNADCLYGGARVDDADHIVIMLHGIGGNAANFRKIFDCFGPDTPHSLIAVNFPGYGSTPAHHGPLDFDILSNFVGDLIASLGIPADKRVHLIGHSIGGMVGLDFAICFPDRVASLTMLAATSAFGGKDDRFKESFLKARLEPLYQGLTMAEMARGSVPFLVGPAAKHDVIAAAEESLAAVSKDVWQQILRCLVTFNRRNDLAQVHCPVLVVAGGHDDNAPAPTLMKMAERLPKGRYICQDDAGHLLPLELDDNIGKVIIDFIDG